jgi:hypothetical protein
MELLGWDCVSSETRVCSREHGVAPAGNRQEACRTCSSEVYHRTIIAEQGKLTTLRGPTDGSLPPPVFLPQDLL